MGTKPTSPPEWPRWPAGIEPARCPVFDRTVCEAAAPPDVVWKWLVRAELWPTWFRRSRDVRITGGPAPELGRARRGACDRPGAARPREIPIAAKKLHRSVPTFHP